MTSIINTSDLEQNHKLSFQTQTIQPADQPILEEMLYQAVYTPEGKPRPERSIIKIPELARYYLDWGKPHDYGLMCIKSKSKVPIGAAWYRLFGLKKPGYGYVDEHIPELAIALLPAYRAQGMGTTLLSALLVHAAEHFSAISLSVEMFNPALNLYQRMGFKTVKTVDDSLTMLMHFSTADD
ncbi:MAG: GNAT family N-acetyltransferase [Anaerolineaceae bacterium]|nr:GNAT family N-acetyltransferase [Anaerolineaceae bacterium]